MGYVDYSKVRPVRAAVGSSLNVVEDAPGVQERGECGSGEGDRRTRAAQRLHLHPHECAIRLPARHLQGLQGNRVLFVRGQLQVPPRSRRLQVWMGTGKGSRAELPSLSCRMLTVRFWRGMGRRKAKGAGGSAEAGGRRRRSGRRRGFRRGRGRRSAVRLFHLPHALGGEQTDARRHAVQALLLREMRPPAQHEIAKVLRLRGSDARDLQRGARYHQTHEATEREGQDLKVQSSTDRPLVTPLL